MKTTLKLLAALALALVAVTLARYRHVDPCKALEREIVRDVQQGVQAARDSLQAALAGLGESTAQAVDDVASAVENVSVGIAEGAARTKVQHMTRRECVVELWRMAREE
jgi:hypothetical protein